MALKTVERRIKPGTLFYRDADRKFGIVVGMKEPVWAMDGHVLESYKFLLFIDGVLLETSEFTSRFSLVQG